METSTQNIPPELPKTYALYVRLSSGTYQDVFQCVYPILSQFIFKQVDNTHNPIRSVSACRLAAPAAVDPLLILRLVTVRHSLAFLTFQFYM